MSSKSAAGYLASEGSCNVPSSSNTQRNGYFRLTRPPSQPNSDYAIPRHTTLCAHPEFHLPGYHRSGTYVYQTYHSEEGKHDTVCPDGCTETHMYLCPGVCSDSFLIYKLKYTLFLKGNFPPVYMTMDGKRIDSSKISNQLKENISTMLGMVKGRMDKNGNFCRTSDKEFDFEEQFKRCNFDVKKYGAAINDFTHDPRFLAQNRAMRGHRGRIFSETNQDNNDKHKSKGILEDIISSSKDQSLTEEKNNHSTRTDQPRQVVTHFPEMSDAGQEHVFENMTGTLNHNKTKTLGFTDQLRYEDSHFDETNHGNQKNLTRGIEDLSDEDKDKISGIRRRFFDPGDEFYESERDHIIESTAKILEEDVNEHSEQTVPLQYDNNHLTRGTISMLLGPEEWEEYQNSTEIMQN